MVTAPEMEIQCIPIIYHLDNMTCAVFLLSHASVQQNRQTVKRPHMLNTSSALLKILPLQLKPCSLHQYVDADTCSTIHQAARLPATGRNGFQWPFSHSQFKGSFPFHRNSTRQSQEWLCRQLGE